MASSAVDNSLISKVVGYQITKGNFSNTTPNLPQRIAIFGQVNEAFNSSVDFDVPVEVTTAQKAGQLFGFGSPIHRAMSILRPSSGSGVSGIPTIVYPQAKAVGSTAKIFEITAVGTATANVTHTLIIAGRRGIDGVPYDFTVNTGDTVAEISVKIADAINNVLGAPGTATSTALTATFTSKWAGLTAEDITITVDTNDNDASLTYTVVSTQSGAGTPSIASSLALIGNDWVTVLVNTYGMVTSVIDALEAFNGIPDPSAPTGRFSAIVMKPFFAFTGYTTDDLGVVALFTDARENDVTIVTCPAPASEGLPMEAAANSALLYAPLAQNTPHLDISGKSYPDMPTPLNIGDMANYLDRNALLLKGGSTVQLNASKYEALDFVTTYHPAGENPAQFRYVRNLTIDYNIKFKYYLLEQLHVIDHSIASNDTIVTVDRVIKPMQWVQILHKFADDLALNGLIVDPKFMKDSIVVNISTTNPDRLETKFSYKRPGFARVASTTVEAGFNFNN